MFLITKWFGVFLHDGKSIVDYKLFPRNKNSIEERLLAISKGEILGEEREMARGRKIRVFERRLSELGKIVTSVRIPDIKPEEYGFDIDLIREVQMTLIKKRIMEELSREDIQVIHMVKSLEELNKISNLLLERIADWKNLPVQDESIQYLNELKRKVDVAVDEIEERLEHKIKKIAPNLAELLGPSLAAKLISLAGGLEKLAKLPSSSIQILGAEKALFRFKQGKGTPPKHGVIFRHPLVRSAKASYRGKISRFLASKISLAAKADYFTGNFIGEELKKEIERFVNSIKGKNHDLR